MIVDRRRFLVQASAAAIVPLLAPACAPMGTSSTRLSRVRPSDRAWPSAAAWEQLNRDVGGRLLAPRSPFTECAAAPHGAACAELFTRLRNPYAIGDDVALTQTLGWVDAWTSRPSVYAVAAQSAADVAAAVRFASEHHLRLVVRGGGHSYHGTSNAPDSLLIWTRAMSAIAVHDAFVPGGCAGRVAPEPVVIVGAGAIWMRVYDEVAVKRGRYVQGGGCTTVGVAGLVLGGGFGSFSKRYGLAAASLLEAEVVTADGQIRIANACTHPDLFWALKGGGGGSLGVVTRVTLKTHDLPETFGVVATTLTATSDAAFRRLVADVVAFYAERLLSPHWGEQIVFGRDNTVAIRLVFQGLTQAQAEDVWRPFLARLSAMSREVSVSAPLIAAVPARRFWDASFLKQFPGIVVADDRPGAPAGNVFWAGDAGQVGQVLHAYESVWLPRALLDESARDRLVDALVAATRRWSVALHFNKGLAGAPDAAIAAARETAINPAALDAFALAICAAGEPPAYPGIPGHEPKVAVARERAVTIRAAIAPLRSLVPDAASYVAESSFFEEGWPRAHWGANYARLLSVKDAYDPDGLFFVHHGVGSERWSADGFTRA